MQPLATGCQNSMTALRRSPTRNEILRLVAEGLTNEEIGKKIFISEKTVKTHLTNIFDKLKVNNRFKAALMLMGHPS